MYPEFIAIYIGLIVLIVLAVLILVQLRKISNQSNSNVDNYVAQNAYSAPTQYQVNTPVQGQVVFCRNCATQYDASSPYCPTCGTPR